MSRLSFGQGFAQNWHQTVPRWTYSGLGLVFGVLVWFFPHILKFIFFWAGNKVFSFLQLHVTLPKKHIKKIIQYIFFFGSDSKCISSTFMSFAEKTWHFLANRWSTETFFIWETTVQKLKWRDRSQRELLLWSDPDQKQMCHLPGLVPSQYTGMPLEDRGKAEQPSRITVWHCPVRNRPGQAQSLWEHFGCTVGSSLQLILPWRNRGGSLELHLLWN